VKRTTTNSLGEWLALARGRLAATSEQPGLEASLLAGHVLGKPRTWVLAHPETPLRAEVSAQLERLLERLRSGTPLPYLTGCQEFYGLDFHVTPDVLIPRPETELLVEQALEWLKAHPAKRSGVDVGCGSGCIAVSLAHTVPELCLCAVDISWHALQVARANGSRLAPRNPIHWLRSDLLSACRGPFDLVCANLPYIPSSTVDEIEVARHEPRLALDGGTDGLDLIARLLGDALRWLAPGGLMLLEIEARQGQSALDLARRLLPAAKVSLWQDLAGLDRILRIEASG
jgi:release factor glutamine methyltransferase